MKKLKGLKGKLKGLHAEDIQATVRSAKEQLKDCQNQLHKDPHNKDSIHKEYKANKQVREVGDSNSKVFFNSLKVRTSRNTINRLMDNQGRWVEDMESITKAFISFYNTLLQGTDHRTPLIPDIVGLGKRLTDQHKMMSRLQFF
ncbi:Golgin subfamily A member 5 [Bienertia sinuspersici]